MPILWHVVQIYAAQGLRDFLLLTGYRGDAGRGVRAARRSGPRGSTCAASTRGWTRRPAGGCGGCARSWAGAVPRHLRRRRGRHRPRRAARVPRARTAGSATVTVVRPRLPFGVALVDGDARVGVRGEAARRALDQRRLLRLRARRARVPARGLGAGARAARAPGRRRRAARVPPRGLLGVHGHLQGRGRAQRPVGVRDGPWRTLRSAVGARPRGPGRRGSGCARGCSRPSCSASPARDGYRGRAGGDRHATLVRGSVTGGAEAVQNFTRFERR